MTGMTISAFIKNILNKENKKLRLQKYIADAGVCSRRKAEELIANGEVKNYGKKDDILPDLLHRENTGFGCVKL